MRVDARVKIVNMGRKGNGSSTYKIKVDDNCYYLTQSTGVVLPEGHSKPRVINKKNRAYQRAALTFAPDCRQCSKCPM